MAASTSSAESAPAPMFSTTHDAFAPEHVGQARTRSDGDDGHAGPAFRRRGGELIGEPGDLDLVRPPGANAGFYGPRRRRRRGCGRSIAPSRCRRRPASRQGRRAARATLYCIVLGLEQVLDLVGERPARRQRRGGPSRTGVAERPVRSSRGASARLRDARRGELSANRPSTVRTRASRTITRPRPPASTTPAARNTSSCSVVRTRADAAPAMRHATTADSSVASRRRPVGCGPGHAENRALHRIADRGVGTADRMVQARPALSAPIAAASGPPNQPTRAAAEPGSRRNCLVHRGSPRRTSGPGQHRPPIGGRRVRRGAWFAACIVIAMLVPVSRSGMG